MKLISLCVLFLLVLVNATSNIKQEQEQQQDAALLQYIEQVIFSLLKLNEAELIQTIKESGLGHIVHFNYKGEEQQPQQPQQPQHATSQYRPVVQMHGMGDFAANPAGMVPLKKFISENLNNTYVLNVALGSNPIADMLNTFIMNMDHEVDTFATAVRNDVNLANGFNAIGYSQGNLIIRGYVERYNSPPVYNWVSVHGPLLGVASFPQCNLTSTLCQLFADVLGDLAYIPLIQSFLAQANYFRDPMNIGAYLAGDLFLADINNERDNKNKTYTDNFLSLNHTTLVKALMDSMVWPNESEWFGFYEDGSQTQVVGMRDTAWYTNDYFGLKTADEQGRITLLTTPGNHLEFSNEFILQMINDYFRN